VGSAGDRPTLTVSDSGIGIPADQLPRIFERFYRGDPARTRGDADGVRRDGAGLGLSIAKWIADAHGAEIVVNSALAQGTRVTVSFPPATAAAAEPLPSRAHAT
jgi:signal transduction histidine kinase